EFWTDINLAKGHIAVADLNGDSLPDLAALDKGEWWPGDGRARFGRAAPPPLLCYSQLVKSLGMTGLPMAMPPIGGYDADNARLHDVNGDGLDDLVYLTATSVDVYLNTAKDGFATAPAVSIPQADLPANVLDVQFADMDASGVDDLVFVGTST